MVISTLESGSVEVKRGDILLMRVCFESLEGGVLKDERARVIKEGSDGIVVKFSWGNTINVPQNGHAEWASVLRKIDFAS